MRSLIRRKFSRDLVRKPSEDQVSSKTAKDHATPASDTAVKQSQGGPNLQIRITKENLRKDLLSNKRRDEGGYDSDAHDLDDIARNIGKKTTNKRPSLHSINWTSSTARYDTEPWSIRAHLANPPANRPLTRCTKHVPTMRAISNHITSK